MPSATYTYNFRDNPNPTHSPGYQSNFSYQTPPTAQNFGQALQQKVVPPAQAVESTPDPNFKFDYGALPRDKDWSQSVGPRPRFNPQQPPTNIANIIRKYFPTEATPAAAIAVSEDGGFNPRGQGWNSDGSTDRGIFAINSNTFNGLMQRQGDVLKKAGINSYEDMYDPDKNAFVAKLLKEGSQQFNPKTNGWGGWFGWQDTGFDLNNGYFSKNDRVKYELKKRGR